MFYTYITAAELIARRLDHYGVHHLKSLLLFLGTSYDESFLREVVKLSADIDQMTGHHALAVAFMPPSRDRRRREFGFRALGVKLEEQQVPGFIERMTEQSYLLAESLGIPFDHLPALVLVDPADLSEIVTVRLDGRSLMQIYPSLRRLYSTWRTAHSDILDQVELMRELEKDPYAFYRSVPVHRELFDDLVRRRVLPVLADSIDETVKNDGSVRQILYRQLGGLVKQPRNIENLSIALNAHRVTLPIEGRTTGAVLLRECYADLIRRSAKQEGEELAAKVPSFSLSEAKRLPIHCAVRHTRLALKKLTNAESLAKGLLTLGKRLVGL